MEAAKGDNRAASMIRSCSAACTALVAWALVLPLAGPEQYTTIARATYPDQSKWWVITIVELKDGKIYRADSYFAPDFEPPEWRRDFVEIVPREDS